MAAAARPGDIGRSGSHVQLSAERLHIVGAKAHGRLDVEVRLKAVDERADAVACGRTRTVINHWPADDRMT